MKKTFLKLLLICLALCVSVGSTIAYLSDTDGDVNVMTLGRVEIDLIEQERTGGGLGEFQDDKPILPGVYPGGLNVYDADGYWTGVSNAVDKIVTVKNTGNTPAYVRVWFAFEVTGEENFFDEYIHLNKNEESTEWTWEFLKNDDDYVILSQNGTYYVMATATYQQVLSAGETTPVSLRQVLLDSSADNEIVAALGEKYSIFVVAQGVQAQGFNTPAVALDEGFGDDHPFTGMSEEDVDGAIITRSAMDKVIDKVGEESISSITFGTPAAYPAIVANYSAGAVVLDESSAETGLLTQLFRTARADEKRPKAYYKPNEKDGQTLYDVYILYDDTMYLPKDSEGMFAGCTNMTSFVADNLNASQVASMAHFFAGCSNLTVVSLPEGTKEIDKTTFQDCENLKTLDIPGSVTVVEEDAFKDQPNVTLIVVPNSPAKDACESAGAKITPVEELFTWENHGEYIRITKYIGTPVSVVVPETIEGLQVKEIGVNAFAVMDHITSISMPSTLVTIDHDAFVASHNLTTVTFQEGVKDLGNNAFFDCNSLTNVNIPNSVEKIWDTTFAWNHGIKHLTIPGTVKSIGYRSIYECHSLESVTLGNGITTMEWGNFEGCSNLKSVTIPGTLKELPYELLCDHGGIETVVLKDGVQTIGPRTMNGCGNLKSVIIPESVQSIGSQAFFNCGNLVATVYEGSVAHNYCKNNGIKYNLVDASGNITGPHDPDQEQDWTIGNPTTDVPYTWVDMGGYIKLRNYVDDPVNVVTPTTVNGVMVKEIGQACFFDRSTLESIVISEGVERIERNAFSWCKNLKSVSLPTSLRYIDYEAFAYGNAIESIVIPEGVISIGESAFNTYGNSSSLQSVTLPSTLKEIGDGAFGNCNSLETLIIPASVTTINGWPFPNETVLTVYAGSYAEEWCKSNLPVERYNVIN